MSIHTRFARRLVILLTVLTLALAGIAGCATAGPAAAPQTTTQESGARQSVNQKITPADFQATFVDGGAEHMLVDVRTPEEFASGHIPGAVNIPVQELQNRLRRSRRTRPSCSIAAAATAATRRPAYWAAPATRKYMTWAASAPGRTMAVRCARVVDIRSPLPAGKGVGIGPGGCGTRRGLRRRRFGRGSGDARSANRRRSLRHDAAVRPQSLPGKLRAGGAAGAAQCRPRVDTPGGERRRPPGGRCTDCGVRRHAAAPSWHADPAGGDRRPGRRRLSRRRDEVPDAGLVGRDL